MLAIVSRCGNLCFRSLHLRDVCRRDPTISVATYPQTRLYAVSLKTNRYFFSLSPWSLNASHMSRSYSQLDEPLDTFERRHIGPSNDDIKAMLQEMGYASLDALVNKVIPDHVRLKEPLTIPHIPSESQLLHHLKEMMSKNIVARSLIGMGYTDCLVPAVIQRNILENPLWYTQYTPYQPEISQGRLESLLNFQTMICDLTALPIANASLLDESTAAAEAMTVCYNHANEKSDTLRDVFLVDQHCHPQTIAVVQTRAEPLGIRVVLVDDWTSALHTTSHLDTLCGALFAYPATNGLIMDPTDAITRLHSHGALACIVTDLMALTLLRPPGELGADIAVGSAQRFGIPLGFGGPHAAFFSCRVSLQRRLPGRLVGVSRDIHGRRALRLALQTREQHIRREKATSNICTAQALLANMSAMYAVYHGPDGLRAIAQRIHALTMHLLHALLRLGYHVVHKDRVFDTLQVQLGTATHADQLSAALEAAHYNVRRYTPQTLSMTLDETTTLSDIQEIIVVFERHSVPLTKGNATTNKQFKSLDSKSLIPHALQRTSPFLTHPTFHQYHSETELLRYITHLQQKDLSLAHAMIPLGSCTMKLNATTEMTALGWDAVARIHPFAPAHQTLGYQQLCRELQQDLAVLTGMTAVSLQPNSGAQGEYAGLRVIRAFHASRGDTQRDICLIPVSAHGTNPASASLAGLRTVPVQCTSSTGEIDLADLRRLLTLHGDRLACLMITYPSTYGVFDDGIRDVCDWVHQHGGQVYLDGANMNAQTGLCRPGDYGADVCHLNLHKTFCIPHGGGGPGMGPICVQAHLAPFLPREIAWNAPSAFPTATGPAVGPVAASPYGSASLLPISWAYIRMMGSAGLARASQIALLNANYVRHRLEKHYPVVYRNRHGVTAHEFILDCRAFKETARVEAVDVAKRLLDYGFHSPTMSWPVPQTLMIEPTESESRAELDRFCDALIAIREEIRALEGRVVADSDHVLRNAPHALAVVTRDVWPYGYSREKAGFPVEGLRERKFWPAVSRVDDAYGDRNVQCTCPPMSQE